MDIVVTGRHTAVPERFRKHVQAKLAKLERLDPKAYRVDAELSRERNPRLSGIRERVELTVYSRGPVIRAEAAAQDSYAALDAATAKLNERLRRAADRRCSHHNAHNGSHHATPHRGAVPAATAAVAATAIEAAIEAAARRAAPGTSAEPTATGAPGLDGYDVPDSSPMVVREKVHHTVPMTLDDALSNMELVGHDFYLFLDLPTGMPSVVYRRRGYDYGVIRLGPSVNGVDNGASNSADNSADNGASNGAGNGAVDLVALGARRPATAGRAASGRR